eukprot:gene3200-13220_t
MASFSHRFAMAVAMALIIASPCSAVRIFKDGLKDAAQLRKLLGVDATTHPEVIMFTALGRPDPGEEFLPTLYTCVAIALSPNWAVTFAGCTGEQNNGNQFTAAPGSPIYAVAYIVPLGVHSFPNLPVEQGYLVLGYPLTSPLYNASEILCNFTKENQCNLLTKSDIGLLWFPSASDTGPGWPTPNGLQLEGYGSMPSVGQLTATCDVKGSLVDASWKATLNMDDNTTGRYELTKGQVSIHNCTATQVYESGSCMGNVRGLFLPGTHTVVALAEWFANCEPSNAIRLDTEFHVEWAACMTTSPWGIFSCVPSTKDLQPDHPLNCYPGNSVANGGTVDGASIHGTGFRLLPPTFDGRTMNLTVQDISMFCDPKYQCCDAPLSKLAFLIGSMCRGAIESVTWSGPGQPKQPSYTSAPWPGTPPPGSDLMPLQVKLVGLSTGGAMLTELSVTLRANSKCNTWEKMLPKSELTYAYYGNSPSSSRRCCGTRVRSLPLWVPEATVTTSSMTKMLGGSSSEILERGVYPTYEGGRFLIRGDSVPTTV